MDTYINRLNRAIKEYKSTNYLERVISHKYGVKLMDLIKYTEEK